MLAILYTKEENLNYFNKAIKALLYEAKQTNKKAASQKRATDQKDYRIEV